MLSRRVAKGVDLHQWWIAHLHPAICEPKMSSPHFGRNPPHAGTANDPRASRYRPQIAGCSGANSADKPTISLLERRTGGRHQRKDKARRPDRLLVHTVRTVT